MDKIEPKQSWAAEWLKEMHGCDDTNRVTGNGRLSNRYCRSSRGVGAGAITVQRSMGCSGSSGRERLGATFPSASGGGRASLTGSAAGAATEPLSAWRRRFASVSTGKARSIGSSGASTARMSARRAPWLESRKKREGKPDDHALGRSHGGWGTKLHLVADGQGVPLWTSPLSVGTQSYYPTLLAASNCSGLR